MALYNPQRLGGKLAKRLLRQGFRLAPTIYLQDEVVAELEAQLSDSLGGVPISCAFYFRSLGCFSKTTAVALDESGRALAFVKLGSSVETDVTIAHEGHVLDRLSQVPDLKDRVPRVIARTVWRGFPALLLSVGPSRELPKSFGGVHRAFLQALQCATVWRGELRDSAMWKTMIARFEMIGAQREARWRDRYGWALQQIAGRLGTTILPFGLAHRDFAPWNIHGSEAGELFVFDWEHATDQCTPAWDFYHFHLATRADRPNRFDRTTLRSLVDLARFEDLESDDVYLLVYLTDIGLSLHDRSARSPFLAYVEAALDGIRADALQSTRRNSGARSYNFVPIQHGAARLKPALNSLPANDD